MAARIVFLLLLNIGLTRDPGQPMKGLGLIYADNFNNPVLNQANVSIGNHSQCQSFAENVMRRTMLLDGYTDIRVAIDAFSENGATCDMYCRRLSSAGYESFVRTADATNDINHFQHLLPSSFDNESEVELAFPNFASDGDQFCYFDNLRVYGIISFESIGAQAVDTFSFLLISFAYRRYLGAWFQSPCIVCIAVLEFWDLVKLVVLVAIARWIRKNMERRNVQEDVAGVVEEAAAAYGDEGHPEHTQTEESEDVEEESKESDEEDEEDGPLRPMRTSRDESDESDDNEEGYRGTVILGRAGTHAVAFHTY